MRRVFYFLTGVLEQFFARLEEFGFENGIPVAGQGQGKDLYGEMIKVVVPVLGPPKVRNGLRDILNGMPANLVFSTLSHFGRMSNEDLPQR